MPTINEIKEIERVFKKSISEIEKIDIPTYIRNRDFEEEMNLIDELEKAKEDKGAEIEEDNWAESHGAHQDKDGWVV